ncbi:ATP phosphoribosyltransferase regulatory subunit [uncultured Acetatifactor sp.]|uniref:ATP phosphoribosyltransferase regulatory subunit n=1 Tax=uncultured Acetatifactor sp. TaxID=1671927 RepID=UPI002620955A|nr:ATP phosphoribosyltransferase regulatory subunit [uncultured Acetatifactor sp.]
MSQKLLHTPEGVRDIYGKEYAGKLHVERQLRECIRLYGYEDIQTPTFEFFDVFSREIGTTPSKELYKFFDKEGNTLVLRPDFTPSIARCAAKYFSEERLSLRFSYIGNTFTNTSNLQGKLKEVTQMGAELIGDPSVEADAEIISLVIQSLLNTGLKRFQVAIGDVEYFKGLCEEAGLDEETELDLRAFISGKNYFGAQDLLTERKVAEPYQSRLLKVADMFGGMDSLAGARAMADNARSLGAIDRLEKLHFLLRQYGVEAYVSFDLGMLSKYRYYTGMIFKAYTYGVGDAVVKGGRYDRLLEQFGKDAPAVGFVMVVDSILEALSRQGVAMPDAGEIRRISYSREDFPEKLAEAQRLRSQGIAAALVPAGSGCCAPEDCCQEGGIGHE